MDGTLAFPSQGAEARLVLLKVVSHPVRAANPFARQWRGHLGATANVLGLGTASSESWF